MFEKTKFSMLTNEVCNYLSEKLRPDTVTKKRFVILYGIEVCLFNLDIVVSRLCASNRTGAAQ